MQRQLIENPARRLYQPGPVFDYGGRGRFAPILAPARDHQTRSDACDRRCIAIAIYRAADAGDCADPSLVMRATAAAVDLAGAARPIQRAFRIARRLVIL